MDKFSNGNSNFAFNIFKKMSKGCENVFLSPISISIALSMLASGADGNSRHELIQALHLNQFEDQNEIDQAFNETMKELCNIQDFVLNIANKMYVQAKFALKPEFKSNLKVNYKSEAETVNFPGVEHEINKWVAKQTNDLIKDLFPPKSFDSLTRLVLVNAIYFKGLWAEKFDSERTEIQTFYLANGKEKQTKMMHIDGKFKCFESEDLDCKILGLPYLGHYVSMYAILPNKKDGIEGLKESLTEESFKSLLEGARRSLGKVWGKFPMFKMRFRSSLIPVLKEMGVKEVFGKANLSRMSETRGLFVSNVIHEAFVCVDESGTEAAAATAIVVSERSLPIKPIPRIFIADHPFVFLIHDSRTNIVLFMGTVDNPDN